MNQLIRIEQLTSSFLEKLVSYSCFPGRGKCPFWPTCGPVAQPGILFGRGQSLNSSEFNLCYFGRRWFLCHSSISGLLQQDMTWNIFYHSASNSWNWYQAPAKKSEQVCSGGGHGLFCLILAVLLLRTPMVLTYHEFKTVCLSSVQKRTDNIHSFRLYMFSNNVDIKTNNRNYRKPFW